MRDSHRSLTAAVFGVLVVTSMLAGAGVGPPVGAASAQSTTPDCKLSLVPMVSGALENALCGDPLTGELQDGDIEANETHAQLVQEWAIQRQNADVMLASFGNYLNDSQSIAIMEGKQAYISAMDGDTNVSKAEARQQATQAVNDYYTIRQKNLLASWKTTMVTYRSIRTTAENTSGLPAVYFNVEYSLYSSGDGQETQLQLGSATDVSVPLLNNETKGTLPLKISNNATGETWEFTPASGTWNVTESNETVTVRELDATEPPEINQTGAVAPPEYGDAWSKIGTEAAAARNTVSTFVNGTYEEYSSGNVSTADMVDPYLGAREYEPNSSSSYATRAMSAMGLSPPENLSGVGWMKIEDHTLDTNNTFTGVLMTANAPNGGFAINQTYDASNINGSQFIALEDGGSHDLTGRFTILAANNTDGEAIEENITYQNITYETANATEFADLMDELDKLQAEIDARDQATGTSGGGAWFPDFGFGGFNPAAGVSVLLIAGAGLLVLKN